MFLLLLYICIKSCFRNWDSNLTIFKIIHFYSPSAIQYLLFICRFRRDLISDSMSDYILQAQYNSIPKRKRFLSTIPLSYIKHVVLSNTSLEIDSYEFLNSTDHCDTYKIKVLQSKELIDLTLTIMNPELVFYVNILAYLVYWSSFIFPIEYKLDNMLSIFYDITDATRRVKNMYNLAQIGFKVLNPIYYCKHFIIQPYLNNAITNKKLSYKYARLHLQLYGILQNVYMQPTFLFFENKDQIKKHNSLLIQRLNVNENNSSYIDPLINQYIITDCIWYLQENHCSNIILNNIQINTNNILSNVFNHVSNQLFTVMKVKMNSQSNISLFELYLWNRLYELSDKKEILHVLMTLKKFQKHYKLNNIIDLLQIVIKKRKM